MKQNPPLVTIIVVTVNHLDLLKNCLAALYRQDYKPIEIIVVDNGSTIDIESMVKDEFPGVHIIRNDKNQGFAGGNNRGIEISKGKYIALINNDATAEPSWISAMVSVAEADPSIAGVASIIIDGNRPKVLDSFGVGIGMDGMSRQALRSRSVFSPDKPEDVLLFSGCACLIRRSALKQVGIFDEDFFAYCEDTDLGLRLRRAGWKIILAPGAYVRHFYSMTGGKFSMQKIYWVERNHFWVAIKNFPWFLLIFLPFFTLFRYVFQGYAILKNSGELSQFVEHNDWPVMILTYLKAYMDMLKKLPAMLIKRRRIFVNRQVKDLDMFRLIWKFHLSINEIIGNKK